MLIKIHVVSLLNTLCEYSQDTVKNAVSTMNTELVKVLRFDPIIDYNKKGQYGIYYRE